tara:strand:- start:592 stop:1338 length:747 start_codon:yes stop_codon:yes gene_type:complete
MIFKTGEKPKIVASIEARMNSTRLPGKVLKEVLNQPMLEIMINRVLRSDLIDDLIIATTERENDNQIVELCKRKKIKYYRGSEDDVLKRVLEAHLLLDSDIIVELTGDCPLIDPYIIDKTIKNFLDGQPLIDYATAIQGQHRLIPDGMDVDIFRTNDLDKISKTIFDQDVREHISPYFLPWNSGKYKCSFLELEQRHIRDYVLRITLDTQKDFDLIKTIHESLYPLKSFYDLSDILNFIDNNRNLIDE